MIFDSNIIIHLLDDAPDSPVFGNICDLIAAHQVRINEIILAEISARFLSLEELLETCSNLGIEVERLTLLEFHQAGQAFREYRRRGGTRLAILPDFLIGAQASSRGWPLVTRDRRGFASNSPILN